MGLGKGKGGKMSDHCITFSVLVLNIFCGILGILVFALAFWFRFEGEVRTWVNDLGMNQYWTGLYILMAASALIVFISICGCTGALTANSCLLATSAVLVLAALILELAGGIFILVHGTHNSKLSPWLEKRFTVLIRDSNYDPRANELLTVVQTHVGCCGSYNYQDFDRSRLPIPDSCRDKVSGNVYADGCVKKFGYFIEKRTGWIAGIALFIAFLQIILVCLTFVYWKRIRDDEDADTGAYRKTKYSTVAGGGGGRY